MLIRFLIFLMFFGTNVYADNPPERIFDEGVYKGVAYNLNCVGDGIVCSNSGITGTLTVSGTPPETDPYAIYKDGTSTTTASIPFAQGINTSKVTNLTTNGFVKTGSSNGTLSVDTSSYVTGPGGSTTQMQYNNGGAFGGTSGYSWTGSFVRFAASQGVYFNGGSTDYIYGDGTNLLIAAANAVVIGNPGDIILGDSTLRTMYPQTDQKIDLGTASFRFNSFYPTNIVSDTSTGIKIGTATTQKLGFFNATPVAQQGATVDLGTALSNTGIRAAGTAYPITTSGATSFTGTINLGGQVTVANAINFALNTSTGTKIGTATSQKLGFFNATPVVQQGATTDLGTVLSNLGLRASGTAYPITTSGSVTLGSLTSGRVPIAGTSGLLGDDADLTFATDTLTVTKIGTTTMTGTTTFTGRAILRSVTDAGPMTATAGTVAEIVFNTSDSKFYGCTVTGSPATWAALN